MPRYSLRQVSRVAVAAAPKVAWEVARGVDLCRLRFVRVLFGIGTIPDWLHGQADFSPKSRVDDVVRVARGLLVLGEETGREVVVGAVGKFWQPDIEFADIGPGGFATFDRPGFGKVAWNIRVDAREDGGSWITVDLRVGATDAHAWARFRRHWLFIGRFSHSIRTALLANFADDLGAVTPEETRALPGDELLPASRQQTTHAIDIEAPPSMVWPWLVQMGAGRAGWYSWDFLDNGGVHSAEVIVPALQGLRVGDVVAALPGDERGFTVLRLEPERLLVLGDPALLPGAPATGGPTSNTTWAFFLEPIGTTATRLVVRVRATYESGARMAVMQALLLGAHEIMERRQLHNLRRRAEA